MQKPEMPISELSFHDLRLGGSCEDLGFEFMPTGKTFGTGFGVLLHCYPDALRSIAVKI